MPSSACRPPRSAHSCSIRFKSSSSSRKRRVALQQRLDLAHRVQHGGVVASAEAPADFRQRAHGQRLGEKHRHLPRLDDDGGAARGQNVGARDAVVARDKLLDVLDLDPLGLVRADQVADGVSAVSTVRGAPLGVNAP